MAVIDSNSIRDESYLLSQTPPDFSEDNYYMRMIQMKVDHDWPYRPNRKHIKEELVMGSEIYTPIEVVTQRVKDEKGRDISDDWYKLVFRDCSRKNRVGYRYRFGYSTDKDGAQSSENIWIGMNQTSLSPTSSQVVCRCNGTIGSIYIDENGEASYHYEPIICPDEINGAGFHYNQIAIEQNGNMMIIAQYNKYTAQYKINQRFILGPDEVYKVTNIVKSSSRSTFDPQDIGIIRLHVDIDQISDLDDFETRMAYNGATPDPKPETHECKYALKIVSPESIPEVIPTDGITLTPQLTLNCKPVSPANITCTGTITGEHSALYVFSDYCGITANANGSFTITRKKIAMDAGVEITFTAHVTGKPDIVLPISFCLRPF